MTAFFKSDDRSEILLFTEGKTHDYDIIDLGVSKIYSTAVDLKFKTSDKDQKWIGIDLILTFLNADNILEDEKVYIPKSNGNLISESSSTVQVKLEGLFSNVFYNVSAAFLVEEDIKNNYRLLSSRKTAKVETAPQISLALEQTGINWIELKWIGSENVTYDIIITSD